MEKEELQSFLLYILLVVVYIIFICTDVSVKAYDFATLSSVIVLGLIIFTFPYTSNYLINYIMSVNQSGRENLSNKNYATMILIAITLVSSSSVYMGGLLSTTDKLTNALILDKSNDTNNN